MSDGGSWIARLITWIVVIALAIVALKLALSLAGIVVGLGFFLLFTVGPIVLIGWLILKLLRYLSDDNDYSEA